MSRGGAGLEVQGLHVHVTIVAWGSSGTRDLVYGPDRSLKPTPQKLYREGGGGGGGLAAVLGLHTDPLRGLLKKERRIGPFSGCILRVPMSKNVFIPASYTLHIKVFSIA